MKKCDCYCVEEQIVGWVNSGKPKVILVSRCNGTRERDECSCNGDKTKCNFYPYEIVYNEYLNIKLNQKRGVVF